MSERTTASDSVLDEIVAGNGITLGEAARLLPAHRGSGRASPSTLWRWVISGAKAADGSTVKLEAAKFGGRHLTTRHALARFAERLSASAEVIAPRPVPSAERLRKRGEAASARLKEIGC